MVNYYTYLEIYLDNLDKHVNLNEFEKHFKRPHQTIKRYLDNLVKNKILLEEKKARFRFYTLNKENQLIFEYISICEKQRLFRLLEKPLLRRLYDFLTPHLANNKILVFGSSLTKKSFSDIDLLILSDDAEILETLDKFQKTYSVEIHAIQTSSENLGQAFIKEIIQNHVILNRHDYFVKLLYKNDIQNSLVHPKEERNQVYRAK